MREEVLNDGRRNLANEDGTSFHVEDSDTGRGVAGPFGSAEYAGRVMDRIKWPGDLQITGEET